MYVLFLACRPEIFSASQSGIFSASWPGVSSWVTSSPHVGLESLLGRSFLGGCKYLSQQQ